MVKLGLETRVWTVVQSVSARFQALRLDRDFARTEVRRSPGLTVSFWPRPGAPEGGALSTRAVLKDASDVKPIP